MLVWLSCSPNAAGRRCLWPSGQSQGPGRLKIASQDDERNVMAFIDKTIEVRADVREVYED